MRHRDSTWLWLIGGAAALAYFASTQLQATPLSIYPSMASSGTQKATTKVIPPTGQFASVQQAETGAVWAQCAGSTVCSPLTADTQLGF